MKGTEERKYAKDMKHSTEELIMKAAEEMFLDRGYAKSTTTAIAAAAGVTHAMLHYYFRTKEQIFIKVLDKTFSELVNALHSEMKPGEPFWKTMKAGIEKHFEFMNSHRKTVLLFFDVIRQNPELAEKYTSAIRTGINAVVSMHRKMMEREISEGRMNRIDPEQLLFSIVSMNVSTFLSLPVMSAISPIREDELERFLENRKREISDTLYLRLYGKAEGQRQ